MSFITRVNWATFDFVEPWMLPKVEVYLADVDSLVLTKEYLEQSNYVWHARRNFYDVPLIDSTKGTFYMLFLGITGKPLTVLLGNSESDNALSYSIFPNPVSDKLYVRFSSNCEITIKSIDGKELKKLEYKNPDTNQGIDLSEISNGIYIISCKFNNINILTSKFIKI